MIEVGDHTFADNSAGAGFTGFLVLAQLSGTHDARIEHRLHIRHNTHFMSSGVTATTATTGETGSSPGLKFLLTMVPTGVESYWSGACCMRLVNPAT